MEPAEAPPLLDELTPLEEKVVDCARRGLGADSGATEGAEALTTIDDPARQVRADLVRELLMGRRGELDPRGVRIRKVRVMGRLDLNQVTASARLELVECALPEGLSLQDARMLGLLLNRCVVSFINGDRLQTEGNFKMEGISSRGPIRFLGARIGGQLDLDDAVLTNKAGPAVNLDSLHATGSVFMRNITATGTGKSGALCLLSARMGNQLHLDGSVLANSAGPAVNLDSLHAVGNVFMRNITATGTGENGTICLRSAHFKGQVHLSDAHVENSTGPALSADRVQVENNLYLRESVFTGVGERGAVRMYSASIGGQISLEETTISNRTGIALYADNLKVGGSSLPDAGHDGRRRPKGRSQVVRSADRSTGRPDWNTVHGRGEASSHPRERHVQSVPDHVSVTDLPSSRDDYGTAPVRER